MSHRRRSYGIPLIVAKDHAFDHYFADMVRDWIDQKEENGERCLHHKIIVTAGPWRPYAVRYESQGRTLTLDFYSALRVGFGHLSEEEEEEIIKLL